MRMTFVSYYGSVLHSTEHVLQVTGSVNKSPVLFEKIIIAHSRDTPFHALSEAEQRNIKSVA